MRKIHVILLFIIPLCIFTSCATLNEITNEGFTLIELENSEEVKYTPQTSYSPQISEKPTPTPQPTPDYIVVEPTELPPLEERKALEYLFDPLHIYKITTQEQAFEIFCSINTLTEVVDKVDEFINFTDRFKGFELSSLGTDNGDTYLIREDFSDGKMKLIYKHYGEDHYEKIIAVKPLPEGYDRKEVYHQWAMVFKKHYILDEQTLAAILKEGRVAPFLKDGLTSDGYWLSDDLHIMGYDFYMPSKKCYVKIYENFNDNLMYYIYYNIDSVPLNLGTCDGKVPLSPKISWEKQLHDIFYLKPDGTSIHN